MSGFRWGQKSFGILILLSLLGSHPAQAAPSPRERISFDEHWRFVGGDPSGAGAEFNYTNIAKWLAPIGPEFAANPSPAKVESNAGSDVSWTQPGFGDHDWQPVNL